MDNVRLIEYEELYNEVVKIRKEIPMLVSERDELVFVVCKNLESRYMAALGALEYKVYEAQCQCFRLKRKIELIRARLNREEKVNLGAIEEQLDFEMEEYNQMLSNRLQEINDAIKRLSGKSLSEKETNEVKELYHKIVKALHPDLNPNISPYFEELFLKAVMAYKEGNLDLLRLIAETLPEKDKEVEESYVELLKTREKLFSSMNAIKEEIKRIKVSFPYNIKDFLEDPDAVEEKRLELEAALFDCNRQVESLEEKMKEMTK